MLLFKMKAIFKIVRECIWGKNIFTYRTFERDFLTNRGEECFSIQDKNDFSIVMQGPYVYKDDFTLKTLLMYRTRFPDAIIIFSSTSELRDKDLKYFFEHNIYYVHSDSPCNPGTSNINFQIVTTASGLLKAKDCGAKYVLKTRSDQRIYNPNLEDYLMNLVRCFPLAGDYSRQKGRLVGCSLNTFKLRPYGMSDMFMFGYLNDMLDYWNVPMEERGNDEVSLPAGSTWRQYSANEVCEVRFCANYLRLIGRKLDFSIEGSMECMARHFVIIDQDALRLIWPKYSLDQNPYKQFGDFPEISFNDWLLVYMKGHKLNFNESALDSPITKES